ncbi:N-acetylglucosamine-6-phosphate deacetylase [Pediococcus claussenii]|uniref:N-acetylglucosamine-6-phosphate deacetylase n=1 Tax=Pediococcus claussenii (strain ATCC BAA-344 / DSM 14800 / JCM 18046 / KCTC 3811 / LMG 21948 / P06) TaxID=701521 RepID=G8PAR3_PEDCP|nr:N-acetylglucosamine-6-phosphate deacetylase [Pediococcus claussenii]AEV94622.1 N-acetylglucosamine-6-phosphate deacetylase [Pediococcus claussenii ATCC BAA-344]ANZ69826.1 N-acetylglucosamine-6-phosphate deacetylase [Pediococcus claussenii]ANZ71643.1 N-acetylglucosamine-6-phosphate deacetylase [Pediococcus claussenii]KRN20802.1 nagA protein [Pediococcus claussenii]
MSTVLRHATIYTGLEKIEDGYIRFGKTIEAVGPMSEYKAQPEDDIHFVGEQIIVPGFIDVHTHGGYGFDAMDGDADQINEMVNDVVLNEGVTSIFCTTMTQSNENIEKAMRGVAAAAERNPVIQGVHLEGPFISTKYKGAQPEEYIKDPNVDLLARWNELSGNRVRLITIAPEHEGADEFEAYCLAHNIVPSVGHSDATRAQLLNSKVTHTTHLYNAQREFKHREPGVTGHAMLEDNIYAELIVDGFHIVPDMLKLAYEIKGPERIDLVTDSMRAKGVAEGTSELGGQTVYVKDKQARLEDGTLAGSVLAFDDAFRNAMRFFGCGIEEVVQMSSVNQAREFGLEQKGTLEVGKDADINVFDANLKKLDTYSYGRKFVNESK